MEKKGSAIILDDDKSDLHLMQHALNSSDAPISALCADSLQAAESALRENAPDLIVSVLELGGNPVEKLVSGLGIPVLLLVRTGEIKKAQEAVGSWAFDYVMKSSAALADIPHIITKTLHCAGLEDVRKDEEKKFREILREKELLVKEIHHRVKNNFQTVCGVLSLQSQYIHDERLLRMLTECQDRVRAMALLHENFYRSNDMKRIDFKKYVENLVKGLCWSYGTDPKRIQYQVEVENVELEIDRSVPCSLIINELVSNSLKHAFPPGWQGTGMIRIRLCRPGDYIRLTVEDNGVGLPEGLAIGRTDSFGLELVTILARDQLNGKIEIDSTQGTRFQIDFKEKRERLEVQEEKE